MPNEIDITKIIDDQEIGPYQVAILVFGFLALMIDSFDAYSIAFVAPSIVAEWGVSRVSFTAVFTGNVAGLALGAIVFGMLAERFGSRRILTISLLLFGVLTLLKTVVASVSSLAVLQFLGALPVGGIYPIVLSIVAENIPSDRRASMLVIVALGFALGAALVGFVAGPVITHLGWRWMFYIGTVLPLLLSCLTMSVVPESLQRLVQTGAPHRRLVAAIRRVAPKFQVPPGSEFTAPAMARRTPVGKLFSEGRAGTTVCLWLGFVSAYLVYYFLFSWIPILLNAAGMPINQSLFGGALYPAGGFIAGIIFALISHRRSVPMITSAFFVLSALSIVALRYVGDSLVGPALFIVGVGSVGGILAGNALVSIAYPIEVRTTGIGWAFGLGRFGSMLGPVLGGVMLELKLGLGPMCLLLAAPAIISAVAFFMVGHFTGKHAGHTSRLSRPIASPTE